MHPILNIAINAAKNAGKIITRFIDRLDSIEVSEKGRNDLVTEVDQFSEQEIIHTIRKSYPDHTILCEESGSLSGNEKDMIWIIDPLDGTMNYVHGFPHYAISIAFQVNGQVEVGVIYDPIRQEYFTAVRGKGAQVNNRRMRVTQNNRLVSALIGTGFPFRQKHNFEEYLKVFAHLFKQSAGMRRAGSAALDLAYVAAGRLDGFWEGDLKIWDVAAGSLLVTEAGGIVSDFKGTKNYLENGNIIAGNPKIFQAILDEVSKN